MQADKVMKASKCHELGLGRGVNITDPQMWSNKSSFYVREVTPELTNAVWTEESGLKEIYEKEVSTVATEQLKLKASIEDPSSQVKVGMDAHYSQSTSSAKRINGIKIKTRSIGFKVDFDDLPLPYREKKVIDTTDYEDGEEDEYDSADDSDRDGSDCFENRLSLWLLKQIGSRAKKRQLFRQLTLDSSSESPSASKTFRAWLRREPDKSDEMKKVAQDCQIFVRKLGVTHYVSAIELGALKYTVSNVSSKKTKVGANAQLGVGSLAEGSLGVSSEKSLLSKMKLEQNIGRIGTNGEVARDTPDEAVIGFQIEPIYKLVKNLPIQVALQRAIKEYVQTKADKTVGPFLIACQVNRTSVYWAVNDKLELMGTTSREDASQFYVIPTGDTFHPSDFYIAYWEPKRHRTTRVTDPTVAFNAPLPYYLSTDCNFLGESKGPLKLKTAVEIKQARFSLRSRVQTSFACMMCLSTPASLNDWIEGEQFYINCSHYSYKISGYIAMVVDGAKESSVTYSYKTVTQPRIEQPASNQEKGMTFRLLPTHSYTLSEQANFQTSDGMILSDPAAGGTLFPTFTVDQFAPTMVNLPVQMQQEEAPSPIVVQITPQEPADQKQIQEEAPISQTDGDSGSQAEAGDESSTQSQTAKPKKLPQQVSSTSKVRRECTADLDPDSFAGQYNKFFGV